ncbi:MAG: arginine decarboxylase, partial [Natronospirillum sp.]
LPQPDIFSESGRAMTAHHAVLVTNIIGIERQEVHELLEPDADSQPLTLDIWQNYNDALARERSLIEVHHDLVAFTGEVNQAFTHGQVTLRERAQNEQVLRATAYHLMRSLNPAKKPHRVILDELNEQMADKMFGNFSLFQSLPDVWGIDQIFPIIPLRNLDQEPTRRGVIRDITCDSDGRIDHYVDGEGIETTLPYPPMDARGSLMGFFLIGAYQEILGDLHNLFGDTNAVDVVFNDAGEADLAHWQRGDSVNKVLQFVNFDPALMLEALERQVTASELTVEEHTAFMLWLREGMNDTTYLDEA